MIGAANTAAMMMSGSKAGGNSALSSLAVGKSGSMTDAQAEKAAKDFESMFISQMLQSMFGDSEGDSAFGDSESNDVYKGLMMENIGKEISKAGGIGIADSVKQELLKLQEH